ncbi:MAG: HNH endonuclease, partial [Lachnospiraceae bacterium]|nr:HNH endonuclease [Lachnospiraceae bacterium]
MFVYVQDHSGQPLMPTSRCGKVRRLLNSGRAKVIRRCPFTIRLLYKLETNVIQPIDLGIDAGSKSVGVSACTDKKELYAAETELRQDVTDKIAVRRELRRGRRYRKTRYCKPRFDNRVHAKHRGWLAPSIETKIRGHLKTVSDVMRILPVTHVTVETASFDLQKIKALQAGGPVPEGEDYQRGEQLGFWNVREYVLFRDGHTCRCCKGKSKDRILNVHHIESRKTGGDAPDNLVTLCGYCHRQYHAGKILLPKSVSRGVSFRDAAFMGVMRWGFYNRLKALYPGMVSMTYGYITKNTRIQHGLEKSHAVDARCIAGHPETEALRYWYCQRKMRCHNRQLHKANVLKGGIRKNNQAPKEIFGFRLFDRVRYKGQECFVFGRRTSGYFDLRYLDGKKVHASASWKQ